METSKIVIDTNILIDLLKNRQEAHTLISRLEEEKNVLCTTVVNVYELYYGIHKVKQEKKRLHDAQRLLRRLPILQLTPGAARKAGHIFAVLEAKGQAISLSDTFIAAIALTRGYGLVTRNSKYFNKIEGLNVIATQKI